MANVHMVRPHNLGKEQALEAAKKVADRLRDKAQINYTVEGDVIRFSRTGAKGTLKVSETEVEVDVEIGLALRPMKGLIESKMGEYFDRYLKS